MITKAEYTKHREERTKQLFEIMQDPDVFADELTAMTDILGEMARTTETDELRIVIEFVIDLATVEVVRAHIASEEARNDNGYETPENDS
jgi:hypothetical protein